MADDTPQLSAEDFAAKVKAKYPDYQNVPDQELTAKILQKYPDYSSSVMAPGVAEARQRMGGLVQPPAPTSSEQAFKPQPSGTPSPAARGGYFLPAYESPEEARGGAKQAIVGAATMGTANAVKGLSLLPKMAAMGTAAGASDIAGDVATGQDPSMLEAAGAGLTAGVLEGIGPVAGKLIKPFITKSAQPLSEAALQAGVTQKAFKLTQMADAEEGIRRSVVAAPRAIRQNVLNKLYPQIDEPVDIYASAKTAASESGKQIAHGTPPELAKIKTMAGQLTQIEGTINTLVSQDASMRDMGLPGLGEAGVSELSSAIQALKEGRQISFSQARNLRSAVGQAIAKGQGYLIPAETYNTLRSVYTTIDKGITDAASTAGKLPELQYADRVYKQFMNDFYNKNAPLKAVLNFKDGMTGKTSRQLLAPANVNRAETALRRWGLTDQADALRKMADQPDRMQAVKQMEDMSASPTGFKGSQLEKVRAEDAARVAELNQNLRDARNRRLKLAAGVVGGGAAIHKGLQWMKDSGTP